MIYQLIFSITIIYFIKWRLFALYSVVIIIIFLFLEPMCLLIDYFTLYLRITIQ